MWGVSRLYGHLGCKGMGLDTPTVGAWTPDSALSQERCRVSLRGMHTGQEPCRSGVASDAGVGLASRPGWGGKLGSTGETVAGHVRIEVL